MGVHYTTLDTCLKLSGMKYLKVIKKKKSHRWNMVRKLRSINKDTDNKVADRKAQDWREEAGQRSKCGHSHLAAVATCVFTPA